MSVEVDVQYAVDDRGGFPSPDAIQRWVETALAGRRLDAEITVRIVERRESASLNETYRHKHGPTNVLSFALEPPAGLDLPLMGDLVICAPLAFEEAREQGKRPEAHWAHLVVHGVLHLLGYDHEQPSAAETMETLETQVLERLGFPNPYVLTEDITHERRPT
jgi:probable rRNA maturation factor